MDVIAEIEALHARLNAPGLVLEKWFRRNTTQYPLISYINIIIGLYYSANLAIIPLFISRAHKELDSSWIQTTIDGWMPNKEEWAAMERYKAMAKGYLTLMTTFLVYSRQIDNASKEYLPDELLRLAKDLFETAQ